MNLQKRQRYAAWKSIYVPFSLGIVFLAFIFLLVALPSDPVWRDRAQAVSDWMLSVLCLIPVVICLFPVCVLLAIAIYGLHRVYGGVSSPLQNTERLAITLVSWIEQQNQKIVEYVNKAANMIEPLMGMLRIFDSESHGEGIDESGT